MFVHYVQSVNWLFAHISIPVFPDTVIVSCQGHHATPQGVRKTTYIYLRSWQLEALGKWFQELNH